MSKRKFNKAEKMKILKEADSKGVQKIMNLLGQDIIRTIPNSESVLKMNKNVNIYGITEEGLTRLLTFFDERIVRWLDGLGNIESIKSLLHSLPDRHRMMLQQPDFSKYIDMKFPDEELVYNK